MHIEQSTWTQPDGWQPAFAGKKGDETQLVLLFGSPSVLKAGTYQETLKQLYPNAAFLGCSTAGEIYGTHVLDNTLVATAIHFEHTQVKGSVIQLQAQESSFEAGMRLGNALPTDGLVHVFALSDGLQVNGSALVEGLVKALPAGVTLTGGLSGDADRFAETLVLWGDTAAPGTIAAVGLYGDRLKVGYGSLGGWLPFGPERIMTEAEGNILYKLDGQPALELYKQYLGDHTAGLPASGLLFPLGLPSQNGEPHLVRTLLAIDEATQSLTLAGSVPQGATTQLMHATLDRLVKGAIAAAETSQHAMGGGAPELAILVSCVGRKLLLQQRIEEEVEGVREVFGESTVLSGFYSYGEISPFASGAVCELHNQTMTITTLTER